MKQTLLIVMAVLMMMPMGLAAETDDENVLLVRYAFWVGGREEGEAPASAGVMSREELTGVLLEWEPESDNKEVVEVLALNHLGEVARQATQLSESGGSVSGVFVYGDTSFEVGMNIASAVSMETGGEDVVTISAVIKRKGEVISRPTVVASLGKRSIITGTNGPEAPFVFLVVEVNRMSRKDLRARGITHAWRDDYMLVDGEEVTAPVAIEKRPPVYPEEARKKRVMGRVLLRMVIDATGSVEDVEVIEGQPDGLSEAAVDAARSWKFEPARYEDRPVGVIYLVTMNFRLE